MATCDALAALITLQLITSQTFGQDKPCSSSTSWIFCPPDTDPTSSDVWFWFKNKEDGTRQIHIECNSNSLPERYLAAFGRLKEGMSVTTLQLTGCPAPTKTFDTWLPKLGSPRGTLRKLRFLPNNETDKATLRSEHFEGLENLRTLEIWNSVETLGPELLKNLISLEKFKYDSGPALTSVHELAFKRNKNLWKIEIIQSGLSSIHKNTFKGLAKLEILDLSQNKITAIPQELLTDLTQLKELILNQNSISELPPDLLLKNPNVTTFSASKLPQSKNLTASRERSDNPAR